MKTLLNRIKTFFCPVRQIEYLPFEVPAGYVIENIDGFDGRILKPIGWHFKTFGVNTPLVVQLAKEDVNLGKGFITGFTINVVFAIRQRKSMYPEDYATAYLAGFVLLSLCPDSEKDWGHWFGRGLWCMGLPF